VLRVYTGMARYVLLKCLILDKRLQFPPSQWSLQHFDVSISPSSTMSLPWMCICFSVRNLQIWWFFLVFTVHIILLMDVRNIISFANIKKQLLNTIDEIWNCYFLLNYVTRFPENQTESEIRIVRLIGIRYLGSSAWFNTPPNCYILINLW
jgi:hypothetical protein